ncbi:hypothetical protein mRhiFer1_009891 [Rhinolophus ferrumequinum]|uniref:Uncharacterized protein n=1 Tax=Rhinolophus ferrumequinum TaxID=59479 RepID=A0A7J7YS90_RHIFE|nr:hypothetical protein mRhiFer1_009891 [Rhinolophus ferrumequinum]
MLGVLIGTQRAQIKKLQKEEELITQQSRFISELKGGLELSNLTDVLEQHFTKEPLSSQSLIPDSQWFALSPQEKLAWAKASGDPRIASAQQSPLEEEILVKHMVMEGDLTLGETTEKDCWGLWNSAKEPFGEEMDTFLTEGWISK